MLQFDGKWRFDSPGPIEPAAQKGFRDLINRIRSSKTVTTDSGKAVLDIPRCTAGRLKLKNVTRPLAAQFETKATRDSCSCRISSVYECRRCPRASEPPRPVRR